ncbi:ZZ-type zinc finger-containing protein 3 [Dissophora ornata]|nr:ZZ-type zinc finger-containing protein 3 [Dissophora ornata]
MSFIKPEAETETESAAMDMDISPSSAPATDPTPAPAPDLTPTLAFAETSLSFPEPMLLTSASASASASVLISTPTSNHNPTPPPAPQAQPPAHSQTPLMTFNLNGSSSTATTSRTSHGPITTSALDRGPLGLTPDEEQWVKEKMEYALYEAFATLKYSELFQHQSSNGQNTSFPRLIVYMTTLPKVDNQVSDTSNTVPSQSPAKVNNPASDIQPLDSSLPQTVSAVPQNQTIDHSLKDSTVIQSSDLGSNSNITYNHISGSVDIQPGTTNIKPRGTSREGSGVRDDPKPPLYNIPWSDEEQQLLEKLLEVYPDEPVAAQRFQKISAAMGTRTPKQVASRVQKYFIKLVKAGLEAPGRMNYSLETSKAKGKGVTSNAKGKKRKDGPAAGSDVVAQKIKATAPRKKKETSVEAGSSGVGSGSGSGSVKKKQKGKSLLGSGFGRTSGTQYLNYSSAPTVYMSEEDDEDSVQDMLAVSGNSIHTNGQVGGISGRESSEIGIAAHLGYACDSCGVEPILGVRYSCMDCEELGGTDLCGPCYNSGEYHNELHLLSHRFQAIDTADMPAYSRDYRPSSAGPSGTSGIYQS